MLQLDPGSRVEHALLLQSDLATQLVVIRLDVIISFCRFRKLMVNDVLAT